MLNTSSINNITAHSATLHETITALTVLRCIPMILIGIASFIGNALVLLAIYRFKHLQTFSNAYVGSLAITDVLASFIMPLSYTTILDGSWVFGEALCQIQGVSLIMLSTSSTLTLLCLSMYRCYLVTIVTKRLSKNKLGKLVKYSVGVIWFIAIFYSITPLFGAAKVKYIPTYYSCLVNFHTSRQYSDFFFVCLFTIPLIVMIIAYARIVKFINIHNQTIRDSKFEGERPLSQTLPSSPRVECSENVSSEHGTFLMELKRKIEKLNNENCGTDCVNKIETLKEDGGKQLTETTMEEEEKEDEEIEMKWRDSSGITAEYLSEKVRSYSLTPISSEDDEEVGRKPERNRLQQSIDKISSSPVIQKLKARSERKKLLRQYRKQVSSQAHLARVLLATVVMFVFCWAPFAVDTFLVGRGYTHRRPKYFQIISMWLAYTNALCNPIIYAFLNKRFRVAFGKILKGMFGRICRVCFIQE